MNVPFSPKDIDAVLFDMDGTLVDTDDADVQKWARRVEHVTQASTEQATTAARRFVMAIETPANAFFTAMDAIGLDGPVISLAAKMVGDADKYALPPVPGIVDLIPRLAPHFKLGIVSTRSVAASELFLTNLNLLEYFPVIGGRDTTRRIKPHPEPVLDVAKLLHVAPERCLMVGDTTVDVLSARRAGAYACAVLCGFGERPELERAGAHLILDATPLVEKILLPEV